MRSSLTRLLFALATIVALLGQSAPLRAQYYCHMLGRVMSECCCETARQQDEPNPDAQIRDVDCCERIAQANHAAVAFTNDAATPIAASALLAILPPYLELSGAWPSGVVRAAPARAPPWVGPPLFIAHCSLLI